MDESVEDDETNRRRRRALVVFFAFVLMTAVGIASLVLLLRGPEDVELARDIGLDVPSDGVTVTPTAAVSITTVSATATPALPTPPSGPLGPLGGAVGSAAGPIGFGPGALALPDGGAGVAPVIGGGGGSGAPTGGGQPIGSPPGGVPPLGPPPGGGPPGGSPPGGVPPIDPPFDGGPPGGTPTGSEPETGRPFTMDVTVTQALYPGVSVPLDIRFSNPNGGPLTLTSLTVTVADEGPADCPMSVNFRTVTPRDLDGLRIPSGNSSLSSLGVGADDRPQLEMIETRVNQNACQGVPVTLDLSGTATGGAE